MHYNTYLRSRGCPTQFMTSWRNPPSQDPNSISSLIPVQDQECCLLTRMRTRLHHHARVRTRCERSSASFCNRGSNSSSSITRPPPARPPGPPPLPLRSPLPLLLRPLPPSLTPAKLRTTPQPEAAIFSRATNVAICKIRLRERPSSSQPHFRYLASRRASRRFCL